MIPLTVGAVFLGTALLLVASYAVWLATAPRRERATNAAQPPVLVVVPVFDEERLIARKLENLAALTYPHRRAERRRPAG